MLAMLFLLNSDPKRLKKLIDEIHDDHLKNLSIHPKTINKAQRLMLSHSGSVIVKTKQHYLENVIAFAQEKNIYGTRIDSCCTCGGRRALRLLRM